MYDEGEKPHILRVIKRDIEMDDEEEKPAGVVAYLLYMFVAWLKL